MKKKSLSRRDFLRFGSAGCIGAAFQPWDVIEAEASLQANSPAYVSFDKSNISSDINLFDNLDSWESWSPMDSLAPYFEKETASENSKDSYLEIRKNYNLKECGCWMRSLPTLQAEKRYHIKVKFTMRSVDTPGHSIQAITTTESGKSSSLYMELNYRGMENNQHVIDLDIVPEVTLDNLALRLYLAWSEKGMVRWSSAHFYEMDENSLSSRIVKSAAISGAPASPETSEECMDFYSQRLDEVGKSGADIVCLAELINVKGVPGSWWENAEPIPGPFFNRLTEKAKQHGMYLVASLAERRNGLLYNTAVLIDRKGEMVGKYEKTHPTISEGLLRGSVPGNKYPIFHTEIGKIGLMICYDNHFPEVSRILAVKGADIIAFPNMGDGREDGTMWKPYMRTRAMDNQVHILTAANGLGQTGIFSPRAELMDQAENKRGAIAIADCDLNNTTRNYSNRPIGKRYLQIRRPETCTSLTKSLFHLEPYSKVRLK